MATTLRLGKTHYEALLPQLEEMGWTSADAHQVRILLLFPLSSSRAFDSILRLFRSTPTPAQALQATGARDLASAIDWYQHPTSTHYFILIFFNY